MRQPRDIGRLNAPPRNGFSGRASSVSGHSEGGVSVGGSIASWPNSAVLRDHRQQHLASLGGGGGAGPGQSYASGASEPRLGNTDVDAPEDATDGLLFLMTELQRLHDQPSAAVSTDCWRHVLVLLLFHLHKKRACTSLEETLPHRMLNLILTILPKAVPELSDALNTYLTDEVLVHLCLSSSLRVQFDAQVFSRMQEAGSPHVQFSDIDFNATISALFMTVMQTVLSVQSRSSDHEGQRFPSAMREDVQQQTYPEEPQTANADGQRFTPSMMAAPNQGYRRSAAAEYFAGMPSQQVNFQVPSRNASLVDTQGHVQQTHAPRRAPMDQGNPMPQFPDVDRDIVRSLLGRFDGNSDVVSQTGSAHSGGFQDVSL